MRKSKMIILGLVLSLLLCGCIQQTNTKRRNQTYHISMIAKSTETEFWKSVIAGANAASAEYNIDLNISAPPTEEDYEAQNNLVEMAIHDHADAIVFSAIDYEKNADVINDAALAGIKIIIIDSDVKSNKVNIRIGTNNENAGNSASEAALLCGYSKLRIGLVNYDKNSANGQAREAGVRSVFSEMENVEIIESINTVTNASIAQAAVVKMIKKNPEMNVVIAFNEPTSVGTAKAIKEMKKQSQIWMVGFDSNTETIDMLQTGAVDALIVQNPYAMGYLGIENAYNLLNGQELDGIFVETPTVTVTKKNMFDEKNQKYLFPFE